MPLIPAVWDGTGCKFHRDGVEARLLTAYRGSATEWVRPRRAVLSAAEVLLTLSHRRPAGPEDFPIS